MKHRYSVGKTNYSCDNKLRSPKNCEVCIKWELENGKFSMSGEIWNHLKTDIICGGQCIDTIAKLFPRNKKLREMHAVWKEWHLNDLTAGCEHQIAQCWEDERINPDELPNYRANQDERGILATWVRPEDHKKGLLTKPCPICGYKYGTEWRTRAIPADVVNIINSWA